MLHSKKLYRMKSPFISTFFVGVDSILVDSTQNGIGAINVGNSKQVTIEIEKASG